MSAMAMQCAWCRRRYDEWGVSGAPLAALLPEASHGWCIVCLSELLSRRGACYRKRGDLERARQFEHTRLALLRTFLRRRKFAPADAQRRRVVGTRCRLVRTGQLPAIIGGPDLVDNGPGVRRAAAIAWSRRRRGPPTPERPTSTRFGLVVPVGEREMEAAAHDHLDVIDREGPGQEGIGARDAGLVLRKDGRQHDHRDPGRLRRAPEATQHLQAGDIREPVVEHDEVRTKAPGAFQPFTSPRGQIHPQPEGPQDHLDHRARVGIVIDDQD